MTRRRLDEVAEIRVFRTYPAPGSSWKPWDIVVDGHAIDRVGGAGVRTIQTDSGDHQLSVKRGDSETETLSLEVSDQQPTTVLVGAGVAGGGLMGATVCENRDDLPKGAIPIHAPGGRPQTFSAGRTKAVVGLLFLFGFDLLLWLVGVASVVDGASSSNPIRVVVGLATGGVAFWLLGKLRPGIRLVTQQWSWPLEDWRVDYKGEELQEWRRWSA